MSKPNKKLLKQTLEFIEKHPKKWEQEHLRCGTSACFAGWASLLSGGVWNNPKSYWDDMMKGQGSWPKEDAWDRAQRVLKLDDNEAHALFDMDNTLERLRDLVNQLCDEDEAK